MSDTIKLKSYEKQNKIKKRAKLLKRFFYQTNRILKNLGEETYEDASMFERDVERYAKYHGKKNLSQTVFGSFIRDRVSNTTDKQASAARNNFIRNMKNALNVINSMGIDNVQMESKEYKLYIVMDNLDMIGQAQNGKYFLKEGEVISVADFKNITDNYLRLKGALVAVFGDIDYDEPFRSSNS